MLITFRSAFLTTIAGLLFYGVACAQSLKPGFDADEYIGVLQRCALQGGKDYKSDLPKKLNFQRVYRSPEVGLHNRWDLWLSDDKTTIAINVRGTTGDKDSWLENFYSAMIPAAGSLSMDGKTNVSYKFANDTKAMVHVGWTIGICSMLPDILQQVNKWYQQGIKQIIVEGHSQGGALAFLLTSELHYLQADGKLPGDIVIKTYCSASPKPGNLYYAYDFDNFTRAGWAYRVVNAADWVPEMPFSVQTVTDVNLNPFGYTNQNMSKNLIVRWYTKHIYKSLDNHTRKAQRKYEKFLGRLLYKQVHKYMVDLDRPGYTHSCYYAPAGNPIVLEPDADYFKKFPDTDPNIFRNHLFEPYYYLVKKTYK